QRLLISVVKISLSCEIGQPPHRNQPGFHPTPICKRYVVGIPAELAKSEFPLYCHCERSEAIPKSLVTYEGFIKRTDNLDLV
ncbi:MAG: hypothetical protein ACRC62_07845, partial [Microcoleus sp.]